MFWVGLIFILMTCHIYKNVTRQNMTVFQDLPSESFRSCLLLLFVTDLPTHSLLSRSRSKV